MNSSESVTELPLEGTSAIGTKTDRHTPPIVHAGENAAFAGVAACSAIFLAISCQCYWPIRLARWTRWLELDTEKKHGSLKFHGGEAWGRGVQGAFGSYSGCILPSLVVSSLSRPRSLLIASCCLLFWRVFVRSLREHAGFKEGSLRRLRSFILAIFASKDGRRS